MSEKSTDTETLSINFSGTIRTPDTSKFVEFLDDMKELFAEWETKVQITSMNIAVHDSRKFELVEEEDQK